MAIEVGKTRLEALGEVEEAADLIRYYAKTAEDNAFYDHPMDNLGDAAVHTRSILRPHGVFAVISPFNFPMALAVGPSAAAMMAGNTVVFKPAVGRGDDRRSRSLEAYRDAGVPDGVFNLVMGPGDTVGDELQTNPGIDGIVFTGSYEVGLRAVPQLLDPLPAAVHRRDGRQEPGHRARGRPTSRRRPRGSCARRSASAARSARPTAGSTSSGRSTTSSSGCWSRRPSSSTVGDPLPRDNWLGPGHRPARGRPPPARPSPRRAATARVFTGGEHLTDGALARGFYVEPTVVGACPPTHRLFQDELFAPFTAVARGRLARRGARARQRQRVRADRGRLQRGPRPRSSASSTRSRPASCTSTGAPARRPAPGRASRRSAAGRAPARPASPACRCTTSRSSCGSRATRRRLTPRWRGRRLPGSPASPADPRLPQPVSPLRCSSRHFRAADAAGPARSSSVAATAR